MKIFITTFLFFTAMCSIAYSTGGVHINFGYRFANAAAAKNTAEQIGLVTSNTNEIMLDIHPFSVQNRYLRLGGLISGGSFRKKGVPDQTVLPIDEASVGFGDAQIAFIPEFYSSRRKSDFAFGLALGLGAAIPYMEDENGDNDEQIAYYFFIRPQLTAAYELSQSFYFEIGLGYHIPLAGGEGEFWYVNAESDTVSNKFECTEMQGLFIKAGFVFGSLSEGGRGTHRGRRRHRRR